MDSSSDTQNVNTVRDFEVGVTKGGKPSVIHGGFEYWRHRQNAVGQVTWRCCQFQSMKCPATIKKAGNHVISLSAQHTHEGNVATSRARAAVHQMKQKMTENAVRYFTERYIRSQNITVFVMNRPVLNRPVMSRPVMNRPATRY